MSLDIVIAQKAGEMSTADVQLVSREPRNRDAGRRQADRNTGTLKVTLNLDHDD